jgi:2-C-methyl-D-erythritol 4-phosphate cytidylyltransferase/2-C-methyl-D-erythritol 2,4-cyclodiphosphate synthase
VNEHPIPSKAEVAVVLVAAGRGLRAGRETPKQYVPIDGRPLLSHTLDALAALGAPIQPVIAAGDEDLYRLALASASPQARPLCRPPVHGGQTRQASVLAGLEALSASGGVSHVLIHDGARPRPSARLLASAVEAARLHKAAVPGLHVTDTIKQIDENGIIAATPERGRLRAVQTPQSFAFDLILAAHRNANKEKVQDLTDDAAIAEWAGHKVHVFDGEPSNVKVTNPEDFARMDASLLAALPVFEPVRAMMFMLSGPAIMSGSGGSRSPTSALWSAIPMPMCCCML